MAILIDKKSAILGWVKRVFNGNVAVYIGQKAVKGDFLGQF